ncbi:Uncharacterized protein FWK35_00027054 [Aphis craccivora]|uniref:Uncharacterized protein n=1 Tax=Aphis craccivora TaxID=307492 RepID=A0A6G0Y4Q9_APHCR|nr:Uncharacterized protein FWK35_00027054 [Aphis craccivora]
MLNKFVYFLYWHLFVLCWLYVYTNIRYESRLAKGSLPVFINLNKAKICMTSAERTVCVETVEHVPLISMANIYYLLNPQRLTFYTGLKIELHLFFPNCLYYYILASERSDDECIDFTILCVFFFVCLCTRECVEIKLKFQTLGVISDRKLNLVGALKRSFLKISNSFQSNEKNQKKKLRKTGNFTQNQFLTIDFFIWLICRKCEKSQVDN